MRRCGPGEVAVNVYGDCVPREARWWDGVMSGAPVIDFGKPATIGTDMDR